MGRKRFVFLFGFEFLVLESLSLDWWPAVITLLYNLHLRTSC